MAETERADLYEPAGYVPEQPIEPRHLVDQLPPVGRVRCRLRQKSTRRTPSQSLGRARGTEDCKATGAPPRRTRALKFWIVRFSRGKTDMQRCPPECRLDPKLT